MGFHVNSTTYVFVSTEPTMYVRQNDLQILLKCLRRLHYSTSAVTIRTGGFQAFLVFGGE